jgi:hypothetical protein
MEERNWDSVKLGPLKGRSKTFEWKEVSKNILRRKITFKEEVQRGIFHRALLCEDY